MRYAFISDIHSNIEAFEAVLNDIKSSDVDKIVFLGDIVGYGPSPNECVELLRDIADFSIAGNHDWAVIGKTPADYFNPYAKEAVEWTAKVFKQEHREYLESLEPEGDFDGFQVAHSTPLMPDLWRYIMTQADALENYPALSCDICFVGHSHQPVAIEYLSDSDIDVIRDKKVRLNPESKYIINVGSVGQPRDGNVNSCWGLYDTQKGRVEFRRTPYDIEAVQKKMEQVNLPQYLIERLSHGR